MTLRMQKAGTRPPLVPMLKRWATVGSGVALLFSAIACAGSDTSTDALDERDASSCVTSATKQVDEARSPIQITQPGPLDTAPFAGKKIAVISISNQSPVNVEQAQGITEAFESVGASTTIFDGEGTPDVIAKAFASSIGQKVAGIITLGFDPALVKSAVAEAEAAGIPIVAGSAVSPGDARLPGVVANVAVDSTRQGELQASYALAATNCDLHAAVFFISSAPATLNHADGAQARIESLCGPACSLERIDFSATRFATELPGLTQSTMQRLPETNYLLSSADLFVQYIMQGRDLVGSDIPVAGAQGDTLGDAIDGDAQVVDLQMPPAVVNGWIMADALMRGVVGQTQDVELPVRIVDETNWGTSPDFAEQYPDLLDFRERFAAGWAQQS